MDGLQTSQWIEDQPLLDCTAIGGRVRAVLERTEAAHRRSAARLRASGQEDRANFIERSAGWVRFDLEEPLEAQQLYAAAARLERVRGIQGLADRALEMVLSLARAERGNVQLADPASGELRIVAQYGFDAEFLDHFAVVDDDGSACGRAAMHCAQLVIADVCTDAGFEPHRRIAAASGFRAVQSTPLIDRAGHLVGVVSTHYPRPFAPQARDMRLIKRYADLAGRILATRLRAAIADGSRTADLGAARARSGQFPAEVTP